MVSCNPTTSQKVIKGITLKPPNHYSEFQDQIPTSYPPVHKNEQSLGHERMKGGRISDTLLSRLRLDPARIDQEWLKYSDLIPLANVDDAQGNCPVRCEPRSFSPVVVVEKWRKKSFNATKQQAETGSFVTQCHQGVLPLCQTLSAKRLKQASDAPELVGCLNILLRGRLPKTFLVWVL